MADTIFSDSFIEADTVIGDKWFSVRLGLHYPNLISVSPSFVSELSIFTSARKETINKRKKFFLWRLFQKNILFSSQIYMTVIHIPLLRKVSL